MAARAAIGLPLWLSVVAYVVNPKWLGWSALSLPDWLRWTGTALAILAVPGVFWTFRALGTNVSETYLTKPGQTLVTNGPYRWIRHPLYTTAVGLFLGLLRHRSLGNRSEDFGVVSGLSMSAAGGGAAWDVLLDGRSRLPLARLAPR